jgi:hypothetical protein
LIIEGFGVKDFPLALQENSSSSKLLIRTSLFLARYLEVKNACTEDWLTTTAKSVCPRRYSADSIKRCDGNMNFESLYGLLSTKFAGNHEGKITLDLKDLGLDGRIINL